MMVVQPEERNMYDQYWLVEHLKESYPFIFCFSVIYNDQNDNFLCLILTDSDT
jgi:hypothetical protein